MNLLPQKRRACFQDDACADPVYQDISRRRPAPVGHATTQLTPAQQDLLEHATDLFISIQVPAICILTLDSPESQQHIREQAAASLGQPGLFDFALHHHKRPRLDLEVPVPTIQPARADDAEKTSPSGPGPAFTPSDPSRHESGGWSPSRIKDCLSSSLGCFCPPLGPSSRHSLPDDYHHYEIIPASMAEPDGSSSMQPPPRQSHTHARADELFTATTAQAQATFACDERYPPLLPMAVAELQPSRSKEGMVYAAPPSGTEDQSPLVGAEEGRAGLMPGPGYASNSLERGSFGHAGDMVGLAPPSYSSALSYDDAPDGMAGGMPTLGPRGLPTRRGPFKDKDMQAKTAETRKIGQCIRCRMQRIRCDLEESDPKGPCKQCKKIANSKTIWRAPCYRWKIVDITLFKPGQQVQGHEWTRRWQDKMVDDIGSWASHEYRMIGVTEGLTGRFLSLRVRQFEPQDGDKLVRDWVSGGTKKSVSIPPFAIADMDQAKRELESYRKAGLLSCCGKVLGSGLLALTYQRAIMRAHDPKTEADQRELLVNTLDLWMCIRMTTRSWGIVGDDTLGMPETLITDPGSPLHGKIPLPPVMGAQLDSMLIHQVQGPLRKKVLQELQRFTQERKQKTWFTQYLVTFILLHNLGLITKHDAEYARKHGMKTRFAREDKVKEYNLGANTLLAYFHYCNKGLFPFSEDCKGTDIQTLAEVDEPTVGFIKQTGRLAATQKQHWADLWEKDGYEDEFYYVSQLFERNWEKRLMA
ncbi:hypothetical protein P8C59_006978 [Phyllachora maydis]|uniref:Zn(2)-C6 fungal-type domain-containing protein n=1 Tax=Phyllachora maydis TaxID=1825666 RepID=A0AAD9I962_9PEZI|nr:hypothetical protein P8C59_006978 [Phyllachora maydis]